MTLCEELLKEMALGYDEEIRKDYSFLLDKIKNLHYTYETCNLLLEIHHLVMENTSNKKDWQEFEDDYFALDELINNKYTTK